MSAIPHAKRLAIFSTPAVQKALVEIILPAYSRETGTRMDVTFELTSSWLKRINDGARPDVVIGVTDQVAAIGQAGIIDLVSLRPLVKAGIGVAVNRNHEMPDISTVPALVETLSHARSVAYSRSGASGIYFARLLNELGIDQLVNAKATIIDNGFTALAVVDGRADIAVQQISELLCVTGAKVAGPLPEESQHHTEFSVAIGNDCRDKTGALSFVHFLTSGVAKDAFLVAGLEPL